MADDSKPDGIKRAHERYEDIAERIKHGHKSATLGADLKHRGDWWEAGKHRFEVLIRKFPIKPHHRVIEYGCGSLRVGAHFIHYLDPGNYFGVDVAPSLVEIGKELVGEDVLRAKRPYLDGINDKSLTDAEAFHADFVYSWLVALHVDPDENQYYLDNLVRLTNKKGAILFFNTKLAGETFKFGSTSWARPVEVYREGLSALTFVKMHHETPAKPKKKQTAEFSNALMEFRRE